MKSSHLIFVACAGGVLASSTLPAAVLVSNQDRTPEFGWGIFTTSYYATSFTTGAGAGWSLDSLDLRMEAAGSPGVLTITLNANNGGSPGGLIAGTSTPAPPTVEGVYSFTPDASVTLAPSTTYWVVAAATGGPPDGFYAWRGTDARGQSGLFGWSIGDNFMTSVDQGAGWFASTANAGMLAVNGTAVPEPLEAAGAAGLGLAGFAAWRRLRRTATR